MTNPKDLVENAFINETLKHVLDGNKGSNILGAILVPALGAKIDWALCVRGLKFDDMAAAAELAKLTGILVLGTYAFFVGRKKKSEV